MALPMLNKFRIIFSTNISGSKQFSLRDKNIKHNIGQFSKEKKLLNRGDRVMYINPDDPQRSGKIAVIERLNFAPITGRPRHSNFTQTPRADPAMGIGVSISPEPAISYNIKINRSAVQNLARPMRTLRSVKKTHLIYKSRDLKRWLHGYSEPVATLTAPASITRMNNYITQMSKQLFKSGTTFYPDLIVNEKTKKLEAAENKEYKIKNYIITVQPNKHLFKILSGGGATSRNIGIYVKLFLEKATKPNVTIMGIPMHIKSVNDHAKSIAMNCKYHWSALKNIGSRMRGGRRTRRIKKRRRTKSHKKRKSRKKRRPRGKRRTKKNC